MDSILTFISTVLAESLNWFIFFVAIVELAVMIISWRKLSALKKEIDDINKVPDRMVKSLTHEHRRVSKTYLMRSVELDWTRFDNFCNTYQKDSIWYSAFSMIIQLFTLLGILGTVCGLFLALRSGMNMQSPSQLYDGVKFALSSTILGIICAVVFKFFDIIISSGWVNYIDEGIVRFQNNYREDKVPQYTVSDEKKEEQKEEPKKEEAKKEEPKKEWKTAAKPLTEKPVSEKNAEDKGTRSESAETRPAEKKTSEKKPAEKKPTEKKSAEKIQTENMQAEIKSAAEDPQNQDNGNV